MTLSEFPPEVLATIFNYLSEYEIKTVSDVNTQWRDIASNWILVPMGHLLLSNPPEGVKQVPFHTVHIDGAVPHLHHTFDLHNHHLATVTTVVLYGAWTRQRITELSHCLEQLPKMTTLEIAGASPPNLILDFLLIRHDITKIRCFLEENQSKSFRRLCERLRTTHGLFDQVTVSQKTSQGLKVYIPKPRSVKYPHMDQTTNLTIHPARLDSHGFDRICNFNFLKSLTLNYLKNVPGHFLTSLPPSLKKLVLHNAKTISHASWITFFKSLALNSLEELSVSGQNQIDASIFDSLDKNSNLRKLYLQMHCPCADQCGVKSLLSWCPNIQVLVLFIPYSSDGVYDLVNMDKEDVRKLRTLNILFQVTPDMVEPRRLDSANQIADKVRAKLPGVFVNVEFKRHLREFLCDDEDDFE